MWETIYFSFLAATVVCLVSRTACQVQFTFQQQPSGSDMVCALGDLPSITFSHLESLLIFKLIGDTRHVQASISAHYGQNDPISHLPGAHVTGHLANDDSFQKYLRIQWSHSETDINGEYDCDLIYVNADYIPLTITKHLTVEIKPLCPCFSVFPEVLQVGLTKQLEVLCTIPDPSSTNISQLGSLEITTINEGLKNVLAEIDSVTGVALLYGSNVRTSVNGSIGGNNNFLQIIWTYPTAEMATEYACEGSGIGLNGKPTFFNRHINVSFEDPDPRDLVDRLFEMYDEQKHYDRCKEELEKLNNTVKPGTTTQKPTENPKNRTCDDFNLEIGEHLITLESDDGLGFRALCRSYGDGNVWTVFQKRFDGSVDFYRNFNDYKTGFGSVIGEFWMGLDNIRRLLLQNGNDNSLRIEMKELQTSTVYTKTFPNFSIGPGDGYMLDIRGGLSDNGFGISLNVGQNFSTYDHGLIRVANSSNRAAGWWFPMTGGYVNINGGWGVLSGTSTMDWYEFRMSFAYPMGETEMMFRRNHG